MEIIGIGIDIIDNKRIQKVLHQWPEQFRGKVFLPDEVRYCDSKKNSFRNYAARFACKEATFKAFGTGWSRYIGWLDVEVVREKSGKPGIKFHGKGRELAEKCGVKNVLAAISHADDNSVAQVMLLK